MTINYGKRNPGGLTAVNPGDTLYIPLSFYNDSGASISIGASLAVTDVELFKNGGTTERATDSGYAILGDTGNFDDRTGFKGISVQLFNTSDDTGFFDAGSQYWVAIDSVTVDARTVRFWAAVFEIGTPRANVVQVDGDTGQADRLGKFTSLLTGAGQLDTGTGLHDTGAIAAAVWDEVLTGATHNVSTSAGRRLRELGGFSIRAATAQGGSSNSITLDASASSTDEIYDNNLIVIVNGTGAGQTRIIVEYDGSTQVATVDQVWEINPDSSSEFQILADQQLGITHHGIAQAGDTGTITLSTAASAQDDIYNNQLVMIRTSAGSGQVRRITDYDGMTKVASISPDWQIKPGSSSVYAILPAMRTDVGAIRGDTGAAQHLAQFAGEYDTGRINVNADRIADDTGFADRLGKFADVLSPAGQIDTGTLDGTQAGTIDANVTYVNETAVGGTGDTGANDPWGPA